jgi:flavodoxin I
MKALVVYDTLYGNTEKIARAVAGAVGPGVKILRVSEAGPADLEGLDVIFVGSPTQGGRATRATQEFFKKVPAGTLKNMRVASFDTRIKAKWVKLFGYAAGRIEKALIEKGGALAAPAGLFIVKGTKGPLEDGEEERAAAWARGILEGGG